MRQPPTTAPTRLLCTIGSAWLLALHGLPAAAHSSDPAHQAAAARKPEQTAWGIAGNRKQARRTIEVSMGDDMRFKPDRITVTLGETVRFSVRNSGRQLHEFVIGTRAVLDDHAALMVKFPAMEHDAPYMAHVAPGRSGEIVWRFNRAGAFDFACLIAGHYQAGMVGRIEVLDAAAAAPAKGAKP